ncbi:MAG TPA: hypothetical protein VNP37_13130 [Actinomycetospora sp.]|nr:hypothetical protein [Actinomycetospora sp.]
MVPAARLHPYYDATYLSMVFSELDAVAPVRGEVVRQLVRGHDGRVRGRYVAFALGGVIMQVQHVAAVGPGRAPCSTTSSPTPPPAVPWRLRDEGPLADAVRTRGCWFGRRRGAGRQRGHQPARGARHKESLLTQLEGEWWMGHRLLYRGGDTIT